MPITSAARSLSLTATIFLPGEVLCMFLAKKIAGQDDGQCQPPELDCGSTACPPAVSCATRMPYPCPVQDGCLMAKMMTNWAAMVAITR